MAVPDAACHLEGLRPAGDPGRFGVGGPDRVRHAVVLRPSRPRHRQREGGKGSGGGVTAHPGGGGGGQIWPSHSPESQQGLHCDLAWLLILKNARQPNMVNDAWCGNLLPEGKIIVRAGGSTSSFGHAGAAH